MLTHEERLPEKVASLCLSSAPRDARGVVGWRCPPEASDAIRDHIHGVYNDGRRHTMGYDLPVNFEKLHRATQAA